MYQDYFRLTRNPFSIAPDPSFLYLSSEHREAMAHLMYGLQSDGGFVVVSGEVGTGKTTLLRSVLEQVPKHIDIAFILNPKLTVRELLETLCDELGIPYQRVVAFSVKDYIDRLNKRLLETHALGRSTVIIIDEAQNLSPAVLEQIRLLTNLETNERKLLRIILLGQPELNVLLRRKELRQLAQRVTARYHLQPLDAADTRGYIAHRLIQAGGGAHLFTPRACKLTYHLSGGIPRLINILSDRSLLGAYVEGKSRVTPAIVKKAAREIEGPARNPVRHYVRTLAIAAGVLVLAFFSLQYAPHLSISLPGTIPSISSMEPQESPLGQKFPADRIPKELSKDAVKIEKKNVAPINKDTLKTPNNSEAITLPPSLTPYESQRSAFATAFSLWHVPFDSTQIPCNYAPQVGLQCLRKIGGWEELVKLNRPAILELQDRENPIFFATIMARSVEGISLKIGSKEWTVSIQDLSRNWPGAFIVLWQMPPKYNGSVKEGAQGPTVAWLRRQLAKINNTHVGTKSGNYFDANLTSLVMAFQASRGLHTDGIVGPNTLLQINSELSPDIPRLST